MTTTRPTIVLALATCVGLVQQRTVCADDAVPFEHAIKVIETLERRIRSAQWRVEYAWGFFDNLESPKQFRPREYDVCKGTRVAFEPWTGRYRFDKEGVNRWFQGAASHIGSRSSMAFDGETEQSWMWSKHGKEMPGSTDPRSGEIGPGKGTGFFAKGESGLSGIGYFPPYFEHKLLSEGLRESHAKRPVRVRQDAAGLWHIEAVWTVSGHRSLVRIKYEPARNGVISDVTWSDEEGRHPPHKRYRYELQRVGREFWVPKVIDHLLLLKNSEKLGVRIVYQDVKINEELPKEAFQCEFPEGTYVSDYVNRKSYQVGSTLESEREQIQRFLREHELWVAQNPDPATKWWRYGMISGGIVLLGGLALWLWRKRRARTIRPTAVAGLFVLCLTPCLADFEFDADGNWLLREKNGQVRRIAQCGRTVTIFTLECFACEYNAKLVSLGLVPSEEGIRLADIQAMLEAHGLETHARSGLGARELTLALRQGRLAIIPVKTRAKANHYVVIQHHPTRGLLLLDPPQTVTAIRESVLAQYLEQFNGLGLLVGPSASSNPDDPIPLSFSPDVIQLGKFEIKGPTASTPIPGRVKIANAGKRAVLVLKVMSSCACATSSWEGGLLRADESKEIEIKVVPGGWGAGLLERQVTFELADGRRAALRLRGEGQTPEAVHILDLSPQVIRVEVDPLERRDQVIEKEVMIAKAPKEKAIQVVGECDWLSGTLGKESNGVIPLTVRAMPTPALLADRPDVAGTLALRTEEKGSPVRLQIILRKRENFRITPFQASLSLNAEKPIEFVLESVERQGRTHGGLLGFSEPPGLDVIIPANREGARVAEVRATPAARRGYYLVHVASEESATRYVHATSLVQVIGEAPAKTTRASD